MYKCYFDGSHRPTMSGCAFCVIVENQIIHTDICYERLKSSFYAEMRALSILLQYIQQQVEPGSTIEIYGDNKQVIDTMHQSMTRAHKCRKTKKLYNMLLNSYEITLIHIPGKENRIAHKLARTKYTPKSKKVKSLYGKDRAFDEHTTMSLDDIIIPYYLCGEPRPEKYLHRLEFYNLYGTDYKTIRVDPRGVLYDGYITYRILKEHGVSNCNVDVMPVMQ